MRGEGGRKRDNHANEHMAAYIQQSDINFCLDKQNIFLEKRRLKEGRTKSPQK